MDPIILPPSLMSRDLEHLKLIESWHDMKNDMKLFFDIFALLVSFCYNKDKKSKNRTKSGSGKLL